MNTANSVQGEQFQVVAGIDRGIVVKPRKVPGVHLAEARPSQAIALVARQHFIPTVLRLWSGIDYAFRFKVLLGSSVAQ